MACELTLAAAGSGKSQRIAEDALKMSANEKSVLILTYTENNQSELLKKICEISRFKPSNIDIKGWFTFLLEDMIRPFQQCVFSSRVPGVYLNSFDPHKRKGRTIRGRSEKTADGNYNPLYFFTRGDHLAHTSYLSKLASTIHKESGGRPAKRLVAIYEAVFIDEVQDLVGWDFDIISAIAQRKACDISCVGDLRQTIYSTHLTQKKPKLGVDKIATFRRLGFEVLHSCISWRCIQPICDVADLVHAREKFYPPTKSKIETIPKKFSEHQGVFVVSGENVSVYLSRYHPMILRLNRTTALGICDGYSAFNFGEAKGLGFDRILILPTRKQQEFLSGNDSVFDDDKTEKAKNTLYVAITRGRYSVAFMYDGNVAISGVETWASGD